VIRCDISSASGLPEQRLRTSDGREKDSQNGQKDIGTTHDGYNFADWKTVFSEYSKVILHAAWMIMKEEIRKPGGT
jgi:hypothetical protein